MFRGWNWLRGIGAVALVASPLPALAQSATELFTPETVAANGYVRIVGTDGETSWLDDGYGKTRFDAASARNFRLDPEAVEADVVWTPRFTWGLSGTVVAIAQQGQENVVDLSEAYLTYKPLLAGGTKLNVRAGLFWPPVSLEHTGPEWRVRDTITPSAIGSWIGEEVKVGGVEANVTRTIGAQRLSGTFAIFGLNDTAGTLLAFRGWALHDEKAVAFGTQPLPPLNPFFAADVQATRTRPAIELDNRPGWYAKLGWTPTPWLDLQAVHYDNRGNPEAVTPTLQWGWRTRFDTLGTVLSLGDWQVRAQGMSGRTMMGFPEGDRLWVDTRFRSGYVMTTRNFGRGSASLRAEAFSTTSLGSELGRDWSENGWALTAAARRDIGKTWTVLVEALHVDSRKDARASVGLTPDQDQTQVQLALRVHL
ncbi:hypothetical protein [Sphingomonas sp.]|jgi:hypothetical protein|uniref:hypothetical protein n=1 Tax=Sphingomonas sp. TaxID=28214 RepID=UPI002E30E1E4|nr:hypothetical protein [Sphingomonas sp.]HEX4695965.1 hypothetical protein [Sphingomonas sp.]